MQVGLWMYKMASLILSWLTEFWFYRLSDLCYYLINYVLRYRRDTITLNIQIAFPNIEDKALKKIRNAFYRNFCDIGLESLIGARLSGEELKQKYKMVNPEVINRHPQTIIIGGHQANWEWGVLASQLWFKAQVVGVYKPLKNKALDQYLRLQREQWGLKVIPMRRLLRWLKAHEEDSNHLVLIADQNPANAKTSKLVTFFNQPTYFMVGPEKISVSTKRPVFFFEVKRIERGKYEVEMIPLQAGEITETFSKVLENSIRKNPETWLWSHRRWKKTISY